ncbi:MAG: DUF4349 domain-containing protein [Nocardioidaceae bacterium]
MTTRTRRTGGAVGVAAAGLLGLAALLAGCASGSGPGLSSSPAASGAVAGSVARADGPGGLPAVNHGADRTLVAASVKIKTGEILLTSRNLDRVRAAVDRQLTALGGSIDTEQTQHRRDGRIESSTLVVRVPVARFTAAMESFGRIGRLRSSDTQSEDVTQQVIDVGERVKTLENSLERLHAFQRRATDVGDLLRYEQAITARQSELQSLRAQRDYLANQTAMSTITLTLALPDRVPPGALDRAGILAGLRAGWHSLVASVVVLLTVVGAVIPFGLALLLLGTPVWLRLRKTLRARRTPPAAPAAP